MKTFAAFLFGTFMFFCALAQEEAQETTAPGPRITFNSDKHDFGDIHQGDVVEHTFTFENSGDEPLVISNVAVTCGCTATAWPREPIAPGDEASITVQFNSAGKLGNQNKIITIYSNATEPITKVSIVTHVLPKKKDS